jgi:rubrerythrin
MVMFFSGDELCQIAVGIEKNGYDFYRKLAAATTSPAAKAVYDNLSLAEKKHQEIFLKLRSCGGSFELQNDFPEEYSQYLRALVDSLVFSRAPDKLGSNKETEIEAVDLGIGAEKDSILFYTTVLTLIREPDRAAVAEIINQEKGHLENLTALKETIKKLQKTPSRKKLD